MQPPCFAVGFPGVPAVLAAHAALRLAAAAVFAAAPPVLSVEVEAAAQSFDGLLLPFAVAAVAARMGRSAELELVAQAAGFPVIWNFVPVATLAVGAGAARAPFFATPAPDSAAELPHRAAGKNNFCSEDRVADPAADSDHRKTAADKWVAVRGLERRCGTSGPIHSGAAANCHPSAHPSVAALQLATRENKPVDSGNSLREYATRKAAPR